MKANPLVCVFLLLFAAAVQLPFTSAGQTNTRLPDFGQVQLPAQQPTTNAAGTNLSDWEPVSPSSTNATIEGVLPDFGHEDSPSGTNTKPWERFASKSDAQLTNAESKLFEESKAKAEKGDAEAEYDLGGYYEIGFGVTKDAIEAVKWYCKAAEQGNPEYQYEVGYDYEQGVGVPKDYVEAAKWYRRAAEQGHIIAQLSLAGFYQDGTGVPKNNVEAYKWYNLAAAHSGKNENEKKLIELSASDRDLMVKAGDITVEEIVEAQRLSREFVPRKESASNFTPPRPDEIIATQTEAMASGTGFFITDDGYLISNYHVVKDATKVRLVTSTGLIDTKVVKEDAANDPALLKAVGRFASLPVATSRGVKLGGTVATVGFPNIGMQGFSPKLAKGEIASLSGAADDARYFQISVPVQPGNSGGALVDEHGNVIGIVSAKLDASVALAASGVPQCGMNYAVKSSFLLSFLESVPEVSAKLKEPITADRKFEDVVKSAQDAAVLVLVY